MSRFLRWWRGPLPIDQLNLIAWHRLISDDRITSYVVTDGGVIIYRPVLPRAWHKLGQAFVRVTVSAQRMTESFSKMVEALR